MEVPEDAMEVYFLFRYIYITYMYTYILYIYIATAELGFATAAMYGITSDALWKYKGSTGTCTTHTPVAGIKGCAKIPENSYNATMRAVATVGPIAISVDAASWFSYSSGVFSGCGKQSSYDLDHAVQLVGYGVDSATKTPYWLVRNSWGTGWGESGYIRIKRNVDADMTKNCKDDNTPLDGCGCKGGPSCIIV